MFRRFLLVAVCVALWVPQNVVKASGTTLYVGRLTSTNRLFTTVGASGHASSGLFTTTTAPSGTGSNFAKL